jgi:surface antigen
MKKRAIVITLLTLALGLSSCTSQPNQEQTGMVIGGALGGLLGSRVGGGTGKIAATIVGTLAGAAVGGAVGRSMDETDRLKAGTALETVRTGVPTSWRNPDTGNNYTITPTRTYETSTGYCREYTMEGKIGGQSERIYGTACRQPNGDWKIQG